MRRFDQIFGNSFLPLTVLICGASGFALYQFRDIFGFAGDFSVQVTALGLNVLTWPVFIAYFVLVNPFMEDYFWRGRLGSEAKSLHKSDFLCAGFHVLIMIGKVRMASIIFGWASSSWLAGSGGRSHARIADCLRRSLVTWRQISRS